MKEIMLAQELAQLRFEKDLAERAFINIRRIKYGQKNWDLPDMSYFEDPFANSFWYYIIDGGHYQRK